MSETKRKLYIDGVPEGTRLGRVMSIPNTAAVDALYQKLFLVNPPDLALDCSALTARGLGRMLKFLEEYKASITLIVSEPVLPTILSRFQQHEKKTNFKDRQIITLKLSGLHGSLKQRALSLFGVTSEDDHQSF